MTNNNYVALENLRSLQNIGAIFRTCSFFGIKNVLLVGYSGKKENTKGQMVLHDEVKKASLGSENDLTVSLLEDSQTLINFAAANKLSLISVEQHEKSTKLTKFSPIPNSILVFGNEVTGVSSKVLDASSVILEIERYGEHNSLNVATSVGIVLFQLTD